jgi:adenosylcobinamide-phosphate synthase
VIADRFWLLALALVLDAAAGDPGALWRRTPHPVAVIGALVGWLDRTFNNDREPPDTRRAWGVLTVVLLIAVSAAAGLALEAAFAAIPFGWIGTVVVATVFIAGRSLYDHVRAVADAFDPDAFAGGLPAARAAVSRIVGRDPESLDEPAVCRAAIESTAENFSDGVVAPALWFLLLGLPGLIAYKAINTADSMIGHRTDRHRDFGWAAARLDDLVNLPASRLSGLLIALAAPLARGNVRQSFRVMIADAGKHRSPNAGWPEAAMGAALGIALAGPRRYAGRLVDDPYMNAAGRRDAIPEDILRGLRVYVGANGVMFSVALLTAAAVAVL